MTFTIANPNYVERVRRIWQSAPFIAHLGMELLRIEPGLCTSRFVPRPEHGQQDGFIHAGAIGTLADHTAGTAAGTLMREDQIVLTSEFKLHLLRPGRGTLDCVSTVLKAGRIFSIIESEVRAGDVLVAKLIGTFAIVDAPT